MPKDFQNAAHWAKEHIVVPPLDEQRIFQRSRHASTAQRLRILAVTALDALLIAGTGTGLAQKVYNGIHIWLSGSGVSERVESLAVTQYPTASEFRSIASRTVVPFVYPVGLAANLKIKSIAVWPLDHPDTISIIYSNGTGGLKGITIVANSAVEKGTPPMPTIHGTGARWSVGNEQVWRREDAHRLEAIAIGPGIPRGTPGIWPPPLPLGISIMQRLRCAPQKRGPSSANLLFAWLVVFGRAAALVASP